MIHAWSCQKDPGLCTAISYDVLSIKLVAFQTFLLYLIDYEIFKSVSNEINYVREFCKQQLKNIQKIRALEQISGYFLPDENSWDDSLHLFEEEFMIEMKINARRRKSIAYSNLLVSFVLFINTYLRLAYLQLNLC